MSMDGRWRDGMIECDLTFSLDKTEQQTGATVIRCSALAALDKTSIKHNNIMWWTLFLVGLDLSMLCFAAPQPPGHTWKGEVHLWHLINWDTLRLLLSRHLGNNKKRGADHNCLPLPGNWENMPHQGHGQPRAPCIHEDAVYPPIWAVNMMQLI